MTNMDITKKFQSISTYKKLGMGTLIKLFKMHTYHYY